jgi:hypothetical protein
VFIESAAGGDDPQSHNDLETQKNKVANDSRKSWCIHV